MIQPISPRIFDGFNYQFKLLSHMVLTDLERGVLERCIDDAISNASGIRQGTRLLPYSKDSEIDLSTGIAVGSVIGQFMAYLGATRMGQNISMRELSNEVFTIIARRMGEIRTAIMGTQ